ncbi:MAG: helix-turn-helix domain-containing protein [Phycicoccus sp.]
MSAPTVRVLRSAAAAVRRRARDAADEALLLDALGLTPPPAPRATRRDVVPSRTWTADRGCLVAAARQRRGWSQDQLARTVGCPRSTLASIETGAQRRIAQWLVAALSTELGLDMVAPEYSRLLSAGVSPGPAALCAARTTPRPSAAAAHHDRQEP